jgi:hypothetical protein
MTDYAKPTIVLDFAWDANDHETLEEALAAFYFAHGLTNRVTHQVVEEHGPGGGWPVIEFTAEDADALYELGTGYGLEADDPRLVGPDAASWAGSPDPEVCGHPDTSSHEGAWTCDHCGADTTKAAMAGLLDNVAEILAQANREEAGSMAQAARIREASIWFASANAAAAVVLQRDSIFSRG